MSRLLITGASGFLGWNLCRLAREHHEVVAVVRNRTLEIPGVREVETDLCDTAAVVQLFRRHHPEAVIHTAAMVQPNQCELDEHGSRSINVAASELLARICASHDLPLVFTSSDLVFDGAHAPYGEDHSPAPINRYGRQKAEAEQLILGAHPAAAVCRLPLLFGDAPPAASSSIQPFLRAMAAGRPLRLFVDEHRTPVSAERASHGLLLALDGRWNGIFHLGGRQRVSRFEMGVLLDRAVGCGARLEPSSQADKPMAAPRPADVSLTSDRARALGFEPGDIEEELRGLECVARTRGQLQ